MGRSALPLGAPAQQAFLLGPQRAGPLVEGRLRRERPHELPEDGGGVAHDGGGDLSVAPQIRRVTLDLHHGGVTGDIGPVADAEVEGDPHQRDRVGLLERGAARGRE
jgi:hypothetical protein